MFLVSDNCKECWPDNSFWVISESVLGYDNGNDSYSNKNIIGIVDNPFLSEDYTSKQYERAWELSETLTKILSVRLNKVHGLNRSFEYWSIHLKIWTQLHSMIVIDRYERAKKAKESIDNLTYYTNTKKSEVDVEDMHDYYQQAAISDDFNSYIYKKIFKHLDVKIDYKNINNSNSIKKNEFNKKNNINIFKFLVNFLLKKLSKNASILLVDSYLPNKFQFLLMALSLFKIVPFRKSIASTYKGRDSKELDYFSRNKIAEVSEYSNSNELLDIALIIMDRLLPRSLLENFIENEVNSYNVYPTTKAKLIFSANSWWFDEFFKHWVAENKISRDIKIIGGKHGGSALLRKYAVWEKSEELISDAYLTWGNTSVDNKKLIRTPANILVNIKKRKKIKGERILFGTTVQSRYQTIFFSDFNNYLRIQKEFIKNIPQDLCEKLYVRLHPSDYGWGIKKRIVDLNANIKFDNTLISFRESIKTCKIYICDHYHTTYIETLALNIPTILFWNSSQYPVLPKAQQYIQSLIDVKIIHETPESAIEWLKIIEKSPEEWWFQLRTQNNINKFLNEYGYKSRSPLYEWRGILNGLAKTKL